MVYHSHNSVPIIKCKIMLLFIVFIVLYQVNLKYFFFETLIFIESCTFVCKSYIDTFTFSTNSLVGSGDRFFFPTVHTKTGNMLRMAISNRYPYRTPQNNTKTCFTCFLYRFFCLFQKGCR